ncbi:MAG TPA: phosphatase PAP2 family protein [Polyangiaceae bacterium]
MLAQTETALSPEPPTARATGHSFLRELGVQDWLVGAYLILLNAAILQGQRGPTFTGNLIKVNLLAVFFAVGIGLTRSGALKDGWIKAILYRLALYAPVQLSYFFFREILPSVNPGSLDVELHDLDIALFGVEPAVLLDRVVTPTTTEWFSFFYFGYFVVLAVHVVPILFFSRNHRVLSEFTLGMLLVFCIGHIVYMLVPGFGPYYAMKDAFATPFPRGVWLDLVMNTVSSGGALKDIFPSLHTAGPLFIALFSYRYRARAPYRYTWPLVAFTCLNIIVATMFLRWHYLIDVVAGVLLAAFVMLIVPGLVEFELERRTRGGLGPLIPPAPRDGDAGGSSEPR